MNGKVKYFMILLIILSSFTLVNASFASDNSTDDLQVSDDVIEVESVGYETNISSTDEDCDKLSEDNQIEMLNSTEEEELTTYVPYCGVNIYNPDFEDGLNGWNVTGNVVVGSRSYNGAHSALIYQVGHYQESSISQNIYFDVIDSVSFWFLPGGQSNSEDVKPFMRFMVFIGDDLIENFTYRNFAWHNYVINTTNYTGWHSLKFQLTYYSDIVQVYPPDTNDFFWVDNVILTRNDNIAPFFNINSIDVVDGNISVKFTDDSFGYISSWLWDFGDGTVSTEKNPTHVYKEPGVYTITETISDGNQFVETNKTVNIKDIFSVDFANDKDSGYRNLTVEFVDNSSGEIYCWFWDFGDGTNSSDKDPVHTYACVGNYNVTLTVSNEVKSLNVTKSDLIRVHDDLVAGFVSSADVNAYSSVVNFTDLSVGNPLNWLWDFGDNSTSADKNPTHRYAGIGDYNVTLTISSPFNATSISKTISVKAIESYIRITSIDKRLLVTGILMGQNNEIMANEVITYRLGNVNGSTVTGSDGVFTIQGTPNLNLTIYFNGNNKTLGCVYDTSLGDVLIKNTVISVSNPYKLVAVDSGAGEKAKTFTFYLKDSDGKALAYKGLKISLNSGTYDVYTDVNGKVSLSVKLGTAKTYSWKIAFAGDDDYNKVTKTVKVVVSKKTSKIVPKKTSYTFKKSAKTKYVQATLKTSNKYLKTGKKVTLTINGKKYTVKAGKNGAIKFNIGSLKKKGTYKVKIKFAGDSTYKACTSKQIKIRIK